MLKLLLFILMKMCLLKLYISLWHYKFTSIVYGLQLAYLLLTPGGAPAVVVSANIAVNSIQFHSQRSLSLGHCS